MKWNWEIEGWPKFEFDRDRMAGMEAEYLTASGVLLGASEHLGEDELQELQVELFSEEALTTSAIEGEFLNRDSVQSSIQRQLGLSIDSTTIPPAEEGIAELTVDLYRTWREPLTDEMLCAWNSMLMKGRRDITDSGQYRVGTNPMKVMSGVIGEGRVHFEAPPSARVPEEMDTFLNWFNGACATGKASVPALTRSGIAHLWFVSIHPFGDGNGRIGRAVAGKALAQTQGFPSLVALAHTIEANRKEYYAALESVNRTLQITSWLTWFAQTVLDAQDYTVCCVRYLIAKAKFYDRLGGSLNDRQHKVIARMFRQGRDGFEGGLSANNYMRIAKTSASTATRDLQDLVRKGAFTRTGELRHARYQLNV